MPAQVPRADRPPSLEAFSDRVPAGINRSDCTGTASERRGEPGGTHLPYVAYGGVVQAGDHRGRSAPLGRRPYRRDSTGGLCSHPDGILPPLRGSGADKRSADRNDAGMPIDADPLPGDCPVTPGGDAGLSRCDSASHRALSCWHGRLPRRRQQRSRRCAIATPARPDRFTRLTRRLRLLEPIDAGGYAPLAPQPAVALFSFRSRTRN
jgi:hypothetical protein